MQDWREISTFPGYSASDFGDVRNDRTDRLMRQSRNTRGFPIVGLMRQGIQHKRAVNCLVGKLFVPNPEPNIFNTLIHCDGDRLNIAAANLAWRPLWYARNYAQQFTDPRLPELGPIEEMETGEVFDSTWDASLRFGVRDYDIRLAMKLRRPVWPTGQWFRRI